jgi:hypothetical protein
MIQYCLFLSLIIFVHAYDKSCSNCKFFIPNKIKPELGLCNMFQDTIYHNAEEKLVKNLAIHCRGNENLCGKSGFLFDPIDKEKTFDDRFGNYEYIKSVCSNEFVETSDLKELEKIEKDLVEVFQRMRRHNKKMIYKTPDQIYKLFKKNKE